MGAFQRGEVMRIGVIIWYEVEMSWIEGIDKHGSTDQAQNNIQCGRSVALDSASRHQHLPYLRTGSELACLTGCSGAALHRFPHTEV